VESNPLALSYRPTQKLAARHETVPQVLLFPQLQPFGMRHRAIEPNAESPRHPGAVVPAGNVPSEDSGREDMNTDLESAIATWATQNAQTLSQNAAYMECQDNTQRAVFLLTYPPFASIASAIQTAEDWYVFGVGIDMIVSAVENAIAEYGIEE
jgi:hypothetical protein